MYRNATFCIDCNHELNGNEMMYSSGRCPYCGFKHPRACTIVEVVDRAYKMVKTGKKKFFGLVPIYEREYLEAK